MSGGFANPITGQNGKLILQQIQSPNYQTGVSGWIIRKDGTAEFNGATFRGTVIVQSNQAILFYSSIPAAGNLVGSLSPVAGTDPFGNTYPAGYMFTNGTLKTQLTVETFLGNIIPVLIESTGGSTEKTAFHIATSPLAIPGSTRFYQSSIVGPINNNQQDFVYMQLASSSDNGTGAQAQGNLSYDSSQVIGGSSLAAFSWGYSGAIVGPTLEIFSTKPGTGTGPTNVAQSETWHNVAGGIGYQNGWVDNGNGYQGVRYRFEAMGGGIVRLDGLCKGGTYANNVVIFRMPSGYIPALNKRFVCQADNATSGSTSYEIQIDNAGGVTLQNIQGAAPGFISFDGMTYPVD